MSGRDERGRRVQAVTSDLWYTMIYLTRTDRRRWETTRRTIWIEELAAIGMSPAVAGHWIRREELRVEKRELAGQSPSIAARLRAVTEGTGRHPDVARLRRRLDRALGETPIRLAPGVLPALDALARKGIPVGLVSNVVFETPEGIRSILRRLGIASRLSAIVLSAEIGYAKPRPEPFRACLRALRTKAEAAVHVGDRPNDVEGALRAGLRPILYTGLQRSSPWARAALAEVGDLEVPHLQRWHDLPDLLETLR
ncbi:MAG: HAD family hydrolase [Thermoplasmata archaeon]